MFFSFHSAIVVNAYLFFMDLFSDVCSFKVIEGDTNDRPLHSILLPIALFPPLIQPPTHKERAESQSSVFV